MTTTGHNHPPAVDPETIADIERKANEFIEASQVWLDLDQITGKAQASALADQIDGLRKFFRKVEAERKDAKQPHLDAGKAVDAAYTPIKGRLETCASLLKKKLEPWLMAERKKADEEERARHAEAAKLRAEADAEAQKAESERDLQARFDAEEKAKAAAEAQKAASAKIDSNAKSATGAGRTIALRTVHDVKITNIRLLFMHYQDRPEVIEVLERLAKADARAADVDHDKIPGIEVTERKVAA